MTFPADRPVTRRTVLAGAAAAGIVACPARARSADRAATPAPVSLGPPEPLPGALYTFNSNILTATAFRGMTYDGPQFEAAVRALRPRGLRFPGGSIANNYLWREDSFSEPKDDKTGWAGEQLRLFRKLGARYDLPGFVRICKRYDLEPIWVLNVYEETPESVAALWERFDEMKLNVTRVEFGNEPYWDGRSLMNVWDYLKFCRPLAAALKKARPAVRIGACFGPVREGGAYPEKWNAPLGREGWVDAAVYHEYYGGQGFALEKGEELPAAALLRPAALVDEAVDALADAAPGKPVWFTEWNVGSEGLKQWKNKGAELLFLAAVYDRLIARRDRVELACFHNIYEQRFGTFDVGEDGQVVRNASWEFFRLLGLAWADATELRPLSLPGATGDDLFGFATASGTGAGPDVRLFLVNRGAQDRTVTLPADLPADRARLTIVCEPERILPTTTPLAERFPAPGGTVVLPAYSINLIASPSTLAAEPAAVAGGVNLFPRRPDLELWAEPYLARQPRFDTDGVYEIDAAGLKTKPLAVLTMRLAGLGLKAGEEYAVTFEARADPAGGAIVKPPVADGEGAFLRLDPAFAPHRVTFAHDPAANVGNVTFIFPQETLSKAGRIAFRNFRIGPAD